MYQNIVFCGLLFSPLVIFLPVAFALTALTRFILFRLNLHQRIWKVAWFEVSLFVCYLALVVFLSHGATN